MRETAKELATLQALIDRSLKRTGPHMKGIIHPGKYSLSARQVVKLLDGMKTVAVAAPAPNGDQLVGRFGPRQGPAQTRPRQHRVLRRRALPHQRPRSRRAHVQGSP